MIAESSSQNVDLVLSSECSQIEKHISRSHPGVVTANRPNNTGYTVKNIQLKA